MTSAVPILNKIHPPLNDLFPTIDRLDLVIPRCQIDLHRAAVCAARILGNDAYAFLGERLLSSFGIPESHAHDVGGVGKREHLGAAGDLRDEPALDRPELQDLAEHQRHSRISEFRMVLMRSRLRAVGQHDVEESAYLRLGIVEGYADAGPETVADDLLRSLADFVIRDSYA